MIDISTIKVAFFDFDGTLVDSERIYNKYWRLAANENGYNLTFEQALNLRSLDKRLAREYFIKLFKDDVYDDIRKTRCNMMKKENLEFKKKAGVDEILEFLKRNNIFSYIVTSSLKNDCLGALKKSNIDSICFKDIISVSEVQNGKPFPDVYLQAIKKSSFKSCECLVFEDSPNGVKSAYSAGCKVCMIPELDNPTEEISKNCSEIVGSFSEFVAKREA